MFFILIDGRTSLFAHQCSQEDVQYEERGTRAWTGKKLGSKLEVYSSALKDVESNYVALSQGSMLFRVDFKALEVTFVASSVASSNLPVVQLYSKFVHAQCQFSCSSPDLVDSALPLRTNCKYRGT